MGDQSDQASSGAEGAAPRHDGAAVPPVPPPPPAPDIAPAPPASPGAAESSASAWPVAPAPTFPSAEQGAPGVGVGARPTFAGQPSPSPLATREPWIAALVYAGLALAGAAAASIALVMLGLIGLQVEADGGDIASTIGSQWFPLIVQLLGAGFLGTFSTTVAVAGVSVSAGVFAVPIIVPVCAVLAVLVFGRRLAPAVHLPAAWRAAVAGIAGVFLAAAVLILQLAAPLSISVENAPGISIRAISAWSVIMGVIVIAAAAFVVLNAPGATRSRWRSGVLQAVEHLGAYGALLAIVVFVIVAARSGSAGSLLLLAPALLPIVAADATALGAFSAVGASVQGGIDAYLPFDLPSASITVFSEAFPLWARIVMPLLAIVVLAIASLRWRARRGSASDAASWFVLPAGYAALGAAVTIVGQVRGGADVGVPAGEISGALGLAGTTGLSAGVGPAVWTFVLFAVFGAAVEALARYAAAPVARVLPFALLRALTRGAEAAPQREGVPPQAGAPAPAGADAPTPHGSTGAAPPIAAAAPAGAAVGRVGETAPPPAAAPPVPAPGDDPFTGLADGHPNGPRQPMSRRARTAWIASGATVLGLVVLIVAGLVVRGYVAGTTYSPQAKVDSYLRALVDGDASAALELWAPNVKNDQRVLLADDIYAAAENRPTDYEIVDVQESGEEASVSATLTVDGKAYDVDFMVASAGRTAVVFDDWRITSGPEQTVRLGDVAAVTQVNGVDVDLSRVAVTEFAEESADWSELADLPVLPGDYTFAAPEADGVFTYGDDQTATALPGVGFEDAWAELDAPQYASFAATWTDEAQKQAIDKVQAHIDECMTSNRFTPKLCPNTLTMYDPAFKAVLKLTRSWKEEPTLRFEARDEGDVVVVEGGELRFDYKWRYDEDDDLEDGTEVNSSPFGWWGFEVPVSASESGEVEIDTSVF